jgi:hypothetical protein
MVMNQGRVETGARSVFKRSGFQEIRIGEPDRLVRDELDRQTCFLTGAELVTVPRIRIFSMVNGKNLREAVRDAREAEKLCGQLKQEMAAMVGPVDDVPILASTWGDYQDITRKLHVKGVYPLSGNLPAIKRGVCDKLLARLSRSDGEFGIIIQPVFGNTFEHRPYGRLYGPVYSGTAEIGKKQVRTTLAVGFENALKIEESERRCDGLREMFSTLPRNGQFIQLNGDSSFLTTLSISPDEVHEIDSRVICERLERLMHLNCQGYTVEWAAIKEGPRTEVAILRMSKIERKMEGRKFAQGNVLAGTSDRNCQGIVYGYAMRRESMAGIDKELSGYVLIDHASDIHNARLQGSEISNAAVVVIINNDRHVMPELQDFVATAIERGKIVMVVEPGSVHSDMLMESAERDESHAGCAIFRNAKTCFYSDESRINMLE